MPRKTPVKELPIHRVINEYGDMKQNEKSLKAAMEPLNAEIKQFLHGTTDKSYETSRYKVKITVQDRSKMDPDKLVWKLKELGLKQAIRKVEVPDEEAINKLIFEGKLDPTELESCMEQKIVETLTITKKSS